MPRKPECITRPPAGQSSGRADPAPAILPVLLLEGVQSAAGSSPRARRNGSMEPPSSWTGGAFVARNPGRVGQPRFSPGHVVGAAPGAVGPAGGGLFTGGMGGRPPPRISAGAGKPPPDGRATGCTGMPAAPGSRTRTDTSSISARPSPVRAKVTTSGSSVSGGTIRYSVTRFQSRVVPTRSASAGPPSESKTSRPSTLQIFLLLEAAATTAATEDDKTRASNHGNTMRALLGIKPEICVHALSNYYACPLHGPATATD